MTDILNKKPIIGQGWLRATIFCLAYFAVNFFIVTPLALMFVYDKTQKVDTSNLMTGSFLWLSLILAAAGSFVIVVVFRRLIDRESLVSLGLSSDGYFPEGASGFFLAPVILGLGTMILFFSGHLRWVDVSFDGNSLFVSFGMMVIVAFSEELVFRGYILNNLMQSFNRWVALFISAVVFAVAHSLYPGANLLSVGGLFLAGILLGINYVYTKNLWFAILFHLCWNYSIGPVLGFKVSGLSFPSLLQSETRGDAMITGGDFGLEASMINILLLLITVSTLYFIYERKYKPIAPDATV